MKKLCIFVLLIAVILCNSSFVFADDATPLFKFACMSDLHLDDKLIQGTHSNWKQLDMVLSAASSKGYTDLFLCDGDVSSYGDTDVWYEARTKIQNAGFNTLLWALGNHAYGTTYVNNDADEDFKAFIGKDSIYYHEVICGCHFLCMGAEKSDLSVSLGAEVYSDAQYEWLATELQAAAEDSEGKPIFVASHYPTEEDGVGERLIPLLSQYDNVVFFWGHEHWSDYADYALSQYIWTSDGFVNARTGCLSYGYSNLADVLLVDVYTDRVVFTYDRVDGKQFATNTLTFELSSWEIHCENNQLYWCVPKYDNTKLLACSYDKNGRMVSSKLITPLANEHESLDVCESEGITKVFFVDSSYQPMRIAAEFESCLIFEE